MAVFFTPLAAQENAGTTSGAASTVSNAQVVLVSNSGATAYLVTLLEEGTTDVKGSFTLAGNNMVFVHKSKFDKIFAGNAAIKLTKCSYPRG
tara:strand:+ start:168 stop:443 length:276 start_codon:yes stop_codon:yes gene_type:complete